MTEKDDLFSLLPAKIFHAILSFLTIDDMFRLSATSKRCRSLCLSAKSLNIDLSENRDDCICHIYTCLIRFLGRRSGKITNLDISTRHRSCYLCNSSFRERNKFFTLVLRAVRRGVQKMNLILWLGHRFRLYFPVEFYRCQTLTDFTLNLESNSSCQRYFAITSTIPFVNLRSLQLKGLGVDDNFGEWISACKTLEKLELENVAGVKEIDIKSSSLQVVKIVSNLVYLKLRSLSISGERVRSIDLDWTSYLWRFKESTSLKIVAPNLEFFKWHGEFTTHFLLDKAMSLKHVELCLDIQYTEHSHVSCNSFGNSMNTKELLLDGQTLKKLYEYGYLDSGGYDVQKLSIVVDHCLENYFFPPAIAHLLKGIKNLKSLCIQSKPGKCGTYEVYPPLYGHGFDMKFWEWNLNLMTFVDLEKVKVEVFKGGNELELLKCLLRNAKQLKEMILLHSSDCPDDRLSKFKKMVSENLASSEVSVVFKRLFSYQY